MQTSPAQPSTASLRVVGIALLLGASIFMLVAVLLPTWIDSGESTAPTEDRGTLMVLSLTHAAVAVSSLVAAFLAPTIVQRHAEQAGQPVPPATRWILRWVVLEGAALLGIVIVLIAGLGGVLPSQPLFYANLASYAVFAAVLITDLTGDLE